ncbi:MAG: hypothetical protein KDD70_08420 [Bdellovibrionales bacterium]|nr:hypothetical protein [Bdellovibrionales bacterium]
MFRWLLLMLFLSLPIASNAQFSGNFSCPASAAPCPKLMGLPNCRDVPSPGEPNAAGMVELAYTVDCKRFGKSPFNGRYPIFNQGENSNTDNAVFTRKSDGKMALHGGWKKGSQDDQGFCVIMKSYKANSSEGTKIQEELNHGVCNNLTTWANDTVTENNICTNGRYCPPGQPGKDCVPASSTSGVSIRPQGASSCAFPPGNNGQICICVTQACKTKDLPGDNSECPGAL